MQKIHPTRPYGAWKHDVKSAPAKLQSVRSEAVCLSIDLITTTLLRRLIAATAWPSPGARRHALVKLSTTLEAAVAQALIKKNPANAPKPEKSFRVTQRTCTACAGVRPPVRHAPCIRRRQAPGTGDALSTTVQLPSYLCDNMLNVQHEPRIHRSAAWPQCPKVADDVCALAQLKLRLGGAGKAPDWYQIGIRQKKTSSNPLIGKVIDLHS